LRDCSKVLALNPQSSKGFYRSGLALIALDRLDEALDCCARCLSFDGNNKGVQTVRDRAMSAKTERNRKEQERLTRLRRGEEAKRQMNVAFKVT
jgi:hypothetical protein